MLTDDAGFGQFGTLGGQVPSPNVHRWAKMGLCYKRFTPHRPMQRREPLPRRSYPVPTDARAHARVFVVKFVSCVAKRLEAQGYIVTSLYDEKATKHNILMAFVDSLSDKLQTNDRVVVFISSHGTSKTTASGTRGYIVPYDGSDCPSDISDAELKDASDEMKAARHQLFIIDACYGGLMITRSGGVPPDYLDEVTKRIATGDNHRRRRKPGGARLGTQRA